MGFDTYSARAIFIHLPALSIKPGIRPRLAGTGTFTEKTLAEIRLVVYCIHGAA